MKKYKGGHISKAEDTKFAEYTLIQRRYMYAKGIIRKRGYISYSQVNKIVKWKFGTGIRFSTYVKAKEYVK